MKQKIDNGFDSSKTENVLNDNYYYMTVTAIPKPILLV